MDHNRFASVILDTAIDKPLDYTIPDGLEGKIYPGVRVEVPVKGHLRLGTVFVLKKTSPFEKVLAIAALASEKSLISEDLFSLGVWMSRYYGAPLYRILKLFLPISIRRSMEEKRQLFVRPLLSRPEMAALCEKKRRTSQATLLDILLKHPKGILLSELLEKAGVSKSPLTTLAKQKIVSLDLLEIDRSPLADEDFFPTKPKNLSSEQTLALSRMIASLEQNRFETHLLFGITGSGKTEVYLQAIDFALKQGKGALFLVPEIALTSQTIERLKSRFQRKIAILHHRLSEGERRDTWHKIHSGELSVVVGPRSALFSPIVNLGLIIVDEEHEGSYKQTDEMPCYHARDTAVMRAKLLNATIILGSATPSLESMYNAKAGKYTLSKLTVRPDDALLPTVTTVDMRQEFSKGNHLFSELLLNEIEARFKTGEQSLLFLNRRGFHTSQSCKECGEAVQCPHCALALTFHKGENSLSCHLCNYELAPPPNKCPHCHLEGALKFRGAGTEQVEKALHAIFPSIRTLRLDADTTRHKGSHEKLFKQFRAGKADVLIGTQMIAKGLHFPSVTLVGVLNADAALQIPDFRSAETVFQLITQVSGRSGRGALAGQVILQTRLSHHPAIAFAAKQDYEAFYSSELETRKLFSYPPFSHLVKCTFSGLSLEETLAYAEKIRALLISRLPPSFEILPVVPCGYAKVKDRYRIQFLVKGEAVRPVVQALVLNKNVNVRFFLDVDPLSTYF